MEIPFNHFISSNNDNDQRIVDQVIMKPVATKINGSISDEGLVKNGEMIPAVNQAAETIFAKSDKAFSWDEFNRFITQIISSADDNCQIISPW